MLPAYQPGRLLANAECLVPVAPEDFSTQRRTRSASAMRLSLPAESRNTMISLRPATCACITKHCPAS